MASVLATRRIRSHSDRFRAAAEGDIEDVDGVLKITEIRVVYHLTVRPEEEDDARWALGEYLIKCPGAMSVTPCIRIEHRLELVPEAA